MKEKKHGEDYKYTSVTTILGILRKPALEYWFKINTAEYCDAESKKGKDIGTALHDAIFNHIERTGIDTTTQYPDEVGIAIKSFMKFKVEHPEIKLKKSEIKIDNDTYRFSGRLDCVAEIDGIPVILDWKSNKKDLKVYMEHYYQLSAYIKGYEEQNNIKISKGIVVEIGKDNIGYNLGYLENENIDLAFGIFKNAIEIYYKQKELEKILK